jgi:YHS domain-containing protein
VSKQNPGRTTGEKSRTIEGDEMVQDPNCKVYIPVSRSVVRRVGGEELHFCSEDCAKNYIKT